MSNKSGSDKMEKGPGGLDSNGTICKHHSGVTENYKTLREQVKRLEDKVDTKVSSTQFRWLMGIIIVIGIGIGASQFRLQAYMADVENRVSIKVDSAVSKIRSEVSMAITEFTSKINSLDVKVTDLKARLEERLQIGKAVDKNSDSSKF